MLCKVLRRGSGVARLEAVLVRGGSGYFLAAVAPMGWSTGDTLGAWVMALDSVSSSSSSSNSEITWLRRDSGAARNRQRRAEAR